MVGEVSLCHLQPGLTRSQQPLRRDRHQVRRARTGQQLSYRVIVRSEMRRNIHQAPSGNRAADEAHAALRDTFLQQFRERLSDALRPRHMADGGLARSL